MFVVKRKTQDVSLLIAYVLLLFASALVRDFLINPFVVQHISGVSAVLVEPIWKLLTWIAPTWLYIQFVEGQNPLTYLKLSTNPLKGLFWGLYGCVFVAALELHILLNPTLHLAQSTDTWVNVILLVGLMEEIPFRGFLFQKLQTWLGFVGAMLTSSLLFALIHVPLWVSTGSFVSSQSLLSMAVIFLVAVLACLVLKISDSLWGSILIHTFYNVLVTIL